MKKLLVATALLILGTAGTAAADRYRGDRRDNHRERVIVRDRGNDRGYVSNRRVVRERDRGWNRRPVYVNNNRFTFHGGRSVVYQRPVIRQRYYDYRIRPTVLVENYETVPGYTWVAGNWQWNGYEWVWTNGYYAVDTSFSYDNDGYYDGGYQYAPVSNGYGHDCD